MKLLENMEKMIGLSVKSEKRSDYKFGQVLEHVLGGRVSFIKELSDGKILAKRADGKEVVVDSKEWIPEQFRASDEEYTGEPVGSEKDSEPVNKKKKKKKEKNVEAGDFQGG